MSNEKWDESHHENFTVKYNGKTVESHEMDANDLAKSLLGLSGALKQTAHIINGSNSNMFVKVKGSFKPGSFDVEIVTFLTCAGLQATLNAVSIVGFMEDSVKSLIWLYKQTKGEEIESTNYLNDNNVKLSFKGSTNHITVNNNVFNLYQNQNIREELKNLVSPLEDENMSDITFLKNGVEQEKIMRDERVYFNSNDTEPLINEGTDYFLITQSNFDGKKTGWKLNFADLLDSKNNQKDFAVKMLDNSFLKNVKNKKIIISNEGTIIKAKYRKIITNLKNATWEILEILEHNNVQKESSKIITHLDDF